MALYLELDQKTWVQEDYTNSSVYDLSGTIYRDNTFTTAETTLNTFTGTFRLLGQEGKPLFSTQSGLTLSSDGTFTMTIDDNTWDVIVGDPDLDINAVEPACFSGRLKISFPSITIGTTVQPAYDQVVFLLFLINSDGVVNY